MKPISLVVWTILSLDPCDQPLPGLGGQPATPRAVAHPPELAPPEAPAPTGAPVVIHAE